MSGSAALASAQRSKTASLHNYPPLAGGYFSLGFTALQVSGIQWSPSAIMYLGDPAELRIQRLTMYAVLCLALGAVVAVFGLYALSGSGKIRRLPLLRTGLITVTAIYILRGLLVIPQISAVLKHPDLVRFVVFQVISLFVGVVYLAGVVYLYRHGRPGETP